LNLTEQAAQALAQGQLTQTDLLSVARTAAYRGIMTDEHREELLGHIDLVVEGRQLVWRARILANDSGSYELYQGFSLKKACQILNNNLRDTVDTIETDLSPEIKAELESTNIDLNLGPATVSPELVETELQGLVSSGRAINQRHRAATDPWHNGQLEHRLFDPKLAARSFADWEQALKAGQDMDKLLWYILPPVNLRKHLNPELLQHHGHRQELLQLWGRHFVADSLADDGYWDTKLDSAWGAVDPDYARDADIMEHPRAVFATKLGRKISQKLEAALANEQPAYQISPTIWLQKDGEQVLARQLANFVHADEKRIEHVLNSFSKQDSGRYAHLYGYKNLHEAYGKRRLRKNQQLKDLLTKKMWTTGFELWIRGYPRSRVVHHLNEQLQEERSSSSTLSGVSYI
jgi:hypothetical protein